MYAIRSYYEKGAHAAVLYAGARPGWAIRLPGTAGRAAGGRRGDRSDLRAACDAGLDLCRQFARRLLVITSYSIHYTKLYDNHFNSLVK